MGKDDLMRILREPKNAIVRQYEKLFEMDDCKLVFENSGLEQIAELAMKKQIGARGLRATFERILRNDMFDLRERGQKKIVIDGAYVSDQMNKTDEDFRREIAKARGIYVTK